MVGTSGATELGTRLTTAELEVGGVEGASVEALLAAGVNPGDEVLRELLGAHPNVRSNSGILACIFGSESGFSYSHSSGAFRDSATQNIPDQRTVASFGRCH